MQTDYELCFCAAGRRAYVLRETCVILSQGQAMLVPMQQQIARPVDLTGREDGVSVFLACTAEERSALAQCCNENRCCIILSAQIAAAFGILMHRDTGAQMRRLKTAELLLLLQAVRPEEMLSPQCCTREELTIAAEAFACAMSRTQDAVTVQSLAACAGVSATRLKEAFRRVYGLSLIACIRTERMHRAARMLISSDRRIIDIAQDAGYDNSSKFAHAFRKVMGCLPGEYRRMHSDGTEHHSRSC